MGDHYHGKAQVTMDGSNVPIGVIIDIDDVSREDWHATIEFESSEVALSGHTAHVVLLEDPQLGFAAIADFADTGPHGCSLVGSRAFLTGTP